MNLSRKAWTLFQYSIRRLIVRSREVSKPRDLYLDLSARSEIWQAPRQHCCRCACQISKLCDNLNYQSRGFETSRDLTIRCLIGYWNGALVQAGPCFNINIVVSHSDTRYRNFHYKEKTVRGLSCIMEILIPVRRYGHIKRAPRSSSITLIVRNFSWTFDTFLVNVLSTELLVANTSANR